MNIFQVNLQIPDKPGLPTLKQLTDTNYGITRSFDASVNSTESHDVNSHNHEIDNKVPQIIDSDGIKVRVKILDDYGSGEVKINQFAVLSLPQGAINSNITNTILKIEVINNSAEGQSDDEIQENRLSRRRRVEENVTVESWTRGSRRRGTVRQQSTTPQWTNSRRRNVRRRGNSIITIVDPKSQSAEVITDTAPMSSIENGITTIRPTTFQGSSPVVHGSDEPVRGFFITKSLDEVPGVTEKINSREFTTEIPSTIASEISTTIKEGEDEGEKWSNEVDGEKSTTVIEDTLVPTTFRPVEMTYNEEGDDDIEETTVAPDITTYHPLKSITNEELEIKEEIMVNDEVYKIETAEIISEEKPTINSGSATTIYDKPDKLNESNFVTVESNDEYTTTESYNEAIVSTTPGSFTAVKNEINGQSGEISTRFEDTTDKMIDYGTTIKTVETSFTNQAIEEIDNKSTIILKIIPFTREDEENLSFTSSQRPSTEEVKNEERMTNILKETTQSQIIPLTPAQDTPNDAEISGSNASHLQEPSSTPGTSPLIISALSSSTTPMSTTSSTTTIPVPSKRPRTDIRSRGRIRYQQPSSSTPPASRERKPRPFRRRPQSSESVESSEQSSASSSQQSSSTTPPVSSSTPLRRRTISRGRGRKRNRQTSTTTTEQSFPTEVPAQTSKNEEDKQDSGATSKNSQTGPIKDDDLTIAESSYAGVFGEVS